MSTSVNVLQNSFVDLQPECAGFEGACPWNIPENPPNDGSLMGGSQFRDSDSPTYRVV